jgi:hypothetical protein
MSTKIKLKRDLGLSTTATHSMFDESPHPDIVEFVLFGNGKMGAEAFYTFVGLFEHKVRYSYGQTDSSTGFTETVIEKKQTGVIVFDGSGDKLPHRQFEFRGSDFFDAIITAHLAMCDHNVYDGYACLGDEQLVRWWDNIKGYFDSKKGLRLEV